MALATVVTPLVGSVAAIALLCFWQPIGLVDVAALVSMYTLTMLGVTVGLHRHFAHQSFKAKRWVRNCLAVMGSMAAQGPVIHWVSNHRRHHAHADHQGDPHSPHSQQGRALARLRGLWHAHVGWLLAAEVTNALEFSKDLLRDPAIVKINRLYLVWVSLGLAFPALVGGLISGSLKGALHGFLWGGLVRIFLAHQATWSVNSITHTYGRRAFQTPDQSRNYGWLVIPTFGEAWHNNHHAFPASAFFGLEGLQIDPGGWLVRVLQVFGWVSDVKVPTGEAVRVNKAAADVRAPSP